MQHHFAPIRRVPRVVRHAVFSLRNTKENTQENTKENNDDGLPEFLERIAYKFNAIDTDGAYSPLSAPATTISDLVDQLIY